jgi:hypothetical protein
MDGLTTLLTMGGGEMELEQCFKVYNIKVKNMKAVWSSRR